MDDDFVKYLKFCRDQRFGLPIPDSVIEEMSAKKYAKKSYRNVKWVLAMYCAWKWECNRMPNLDKIYIDLENSETFTVEGLVYSLSHFICEAHKCDGSEFPPKTLKYIILIVQMHLKSLGFVYNFLDDPAFHKLMMCLDNKMKENAAKGLGHTICKAETLDVSITHSKVVGGWYFGRFRSKETVKYSVISDRT